MERETVPSACLRRKQTISFKKSRWECCFSLYLVFNLGCTVLYLNRIKVFVLVHWDRRNGYMADGPVIIILLILFGHGPCCSPSLSSDNVLKVTLEQKVSNNMFLVGLVAAIYFCKVGDFVLKVIYVCAKTSNWNGWR